MMMMKKKNYNKLFYTRKKNKMKMTMKMIIDIEIK